MATQTENQRKAAARKAAATRRRNAAQRSQTATRSAAKSTQRSATRTAETAAKTAETSAKAQVNALQAVQTQAERAVLIPVGAALTARDAVVDATKPYTAGRESAEKELERVSKRVATNLRKFERRGTTARNRTVREVKKTRTRVERELRQRRSAAIRTVKQNRREAEKQVRSTRREFERQVKATSREVIDPELRKDIVTLGMVRSIEQPEEGRVDVIVSLTTPGCPIRAHFEKAVVEKVSSLGVSHVTVGFDVLSDQEKQSLSQRLGRGGGLPEGALAMVKNVICIGSGKGGVGKSTVTANLAAALQADGHAAAALDADVWGYSIPRMLGVHGRPKVSAERKIIPLDSPSGVRAISIEHFLNERDQAITWRGPMLHKAIRQFLEDVDWGELDYLLIDLPPGTGDVSMTLAQLLPQARFVVVTTPQPAAQKVAARAADTAQRFDLELLGVIENMAGFTTPEGERFTIFGEGGGQLLADELDVPLLGKIPLQEALRVGADEGRPLVLDDPDAPASQAIYHAARGILAATPQELPVFQTASGPPVPAVTGTALPMAP